MGVASRRRVRKFNEQDPKWKQKAKLAKLDQRLVWNRRLRIGEEDIGEIRHAVRN